MKFYETKESILFVKHMKYLIYNNLLIDVFNFNIISKLLECSIKDYVF